MVQEKNVAVQIILSLVTCGIYALCWLYALDSDTRRISDDYSGIDPGTSILITVLTCGLFSLYQFYQIGQRIPKAQRLAGLAPDKDRGVLLLVLCLLTGGYIIPLAIAQNDVNNLVGRR
jgi:hypothetical protein